MGPRIVYGHGPIDVVPIIVESRMVVYFKFAGSKVHLHAKYACMYTLMHIVRIIGRWNRCHMFL